MNDDYLNVYDGGNGLAITSFVCGILSVTLCVFSGIPQVIAIITGIIALNKRQKKWMAIAGIIMAIIGLLVSVIVGSVVGIYIAMSGML